MSISSVVTRGYGNGTFAGTIALVALRGYVPGEVDPVIGRRRRTRFVQDWEDDVKPQTVKAVKKIIRTYPEWEDLEQQIAILANRHELTARRVETWIREQEEDDDLLILLMIT